MPRDLDQSEVHDLEALVDACGLDSVLMALSEVCGLKAEHVANHWQDASLAKAWATMCGKIGILSTETRGL